MPGPGEMQRAASKFLVFENFDKLNTKGLRLSLSERELAWLENLQPLAANKLVTVPAPAAAALATLPETVQSLWFASLAGVDYLIAFTTVGSGFSIRISNGTVFRFAVVGTFSLNPDLTVWQNQRVLINDVTSGYATFDGTLFAHQGTLSPVILVTNAGSGYTSPPAVTISGGSGSGATAHAVILAGGVVSVVLDNGGAGYLPTDVLTVTFATPPGSGATAHAVMSGSGVDSVAVLTNGAGYRNGATVTFSNPPGGPAFAAQASAILDTTGITFGVDHIVVNNPGSGYIAPPSVTIAGNPPLGLGSGATAAAHLLGQTVTSVVVDAAGSGYLAAPAVVISGGGGSNATAHSTLVGAPPSGVATVVVDTPGSGYQFAPSVAITTGAGAAAQAHVWPSIPAGSTLAVFQGRVWLGGGRQLQWTGTQGFDDFNPANASGALLLADADLVHQITALRNYNNYLFILGDQSVKQIGNISLNAAANVTVFTILTLSSDQGSIWPRSCGSFNRVFMFANVNGIYAVFGSSVQKISDDLDGVWPLTDFSQMPVAVISDINNIHNIAWLVRYQDPRFGTRSLLYVFDGRRWFFVRQGDALRAAAASPSLTTGAMLTWGSSGSDITQLLANPATPVVFRADSSLSHHGNAVQRKKILRAGFAANYAGTVPANVTIELDSENGAQTYVRAMAAAGLQIPQMFSADGAGRYLGMSVTGSLAGFTLVNMLIEAQDTTLGA